MVGPSTQLGHRCMHKRQLWQPWKPHQQLKLTNDWSVAGLRLAPVRQGRRETFVLIYLLDEDAQLSAVHATSRLHETDVDGEHKSDGQRVESEVRAVETHQLAQSRGAFARGHLSASSETTLIWNALEGRWLLIVQCELAAAGGLCRVLQESNRVARQPDL